MHSGKIPLRPETIMKVFLRVGDEKLLQTSAEFREISGCDLEDFKLFITIPTKSAENAHYSINLIWDLIDKLNQLENGEFLENLAKAGISDIKEHLQFSVHGSKLVAKIKPPIKLRNFYENIKFPGLDLNPNQEASFEFSLEKSLYDILRSQHVIKSFLDSIDFKIRACYTPKTFIGLVSTIIATSDKKILKIASSLRLLSLSCNFKAIGKSLMKELKDLEMKYHKERLRLEQRNERPLDEKEIFLLEISNAIDTQIESQSIHFFAGVQNITVHAEMLVTGLSKLLELILKVRKPDYC